jgi:CheY-like chemotaxis protein
LRISKGVVSTSSRFRSFWNLRRSGNENPPARNARQFAIPAKRKSARERKDLSIKTTAMLLLTNDTELEDSVAEALLELGGVSHLKRDAGDALETVCGVHDLDLAVIDFEHGPHGMTLLSAISMLREDLPVVVITHDDEKHVEALAYANGATACFPKPVSTTQLVAAIREFCGPRVERALA